METSEQLYKYFLSALDALSEEQGRGLQSNIAISSGLSDSYVSQILGRKRKASDKAQASIANGLGYKPEELLGIGRKRLNGKDISADLKKGSTNRKAAQTQGVDAKVGEEMNQELMVLLQHYKDELKELRSEMKDIKEENRELKRSQKQTSEPHPQTGDVEKKTA